MFGKLKRYWNDPYFALGHDLIHSHPNWMSDKLYLSTLWRMVMGYKLDWNHPTTFNEKLQWLKLYDHNPLYTTLVDKYRVKEFVADIIGAEHVIPTLAVYRSVDEIDLSQLPDRFVLKCNHDSGSVVICKDKATFDLEAAKTKLDEALHHNFYWDAREWGYKNVKPLIFAEQFIEIAGAEDLPDYKFFCFDGKVRALYVASERFLSGTCFDFFDMDFNHLDVQNDHPNNPVVHKKPKSFDEMVAIAEKLSLGIPHVRCDLYDINGHIYFGEYTMYHMGGLSPFVPQSYDEQLGAWLDLSKIKK